jgi:hypothetical protein
MSERGRFEAQIALEYATSMARPRLVGTAEHDQVADELVARLEQWGYHVERQPFEFSTALNALLALALFLNVACLTVMAATHRPVVAAITLIMWVLTGLIGRSISSFAVASAQPSWRERLAYRLGKRYVAMNLVAELPRPHPPAPSPEIARSVRISGEEERPLRTLYLVAHYDSKSQRWPLVLRIVLFTLLIPGTLFAIGAALLSYTSALIDVLGFSAAVASALLVMLGTGNASPGAIDNASGAGIVLHLAECLAARSDWRERLRVVVLLPSAEEVGLMGTTAYVKRHAAQLQHDKAIILNFDGVGVDGELQWVGAISSELAHHIQSAAREEAVPIKRFRFIGALFDHIPFAQQGLDAVSLIAVGRASRSIHTAHDTIERLNVRGFDQAGRVALRVIGQLVDR